MLRPFLKFVIVQFSASVSLNFTTIRMSTIGNLLEFGQEISRQVRIENLQTRSTFSTSQINPFLGARLSYSYHSCMHSFSQSSLIVSDKLSYLFTRPPFVSILFFPFLSLAAQRRSLLVVFPSVQFHHQLSAPWISSFLVPPV